ncbi:MAG: hypothetical protein VKJ09_03810 [Leptolyngbya sp.]|nr:hypothetical protein [Leptolyngbya sp.]
MNSLFAWEYGGTMAGPGLLATVVAEVGGTHGSAIALLFVLMVLLFTTGVMRRDVGQITPTTLVLGGIVMALAISAG